MNDEYLTMKEIGRLFGTTSHVIGRWLKEIGLRTTDGKPTRAAFAGGYCAQRWTRDGNNYCWAWSRTKTVDALEESGLAGAGRRGLPSEEVTPGETPAACPVLPPEPFA